MPRCILFIFFLSFSFFSYSEFLDHIKPDVGEKTEQDQIENIDFIYLINLDQRPEKWNKCLEQLKPYGVNPQRFSAIYGWDLLPEQINDLGVKFSKGMLSDQWVIRYPLSAQGAPEMDFLKEDCYEKVVFSRWLSPGALGCALSHISVLQDAYDSGYETIWVMEDDISVKRDPNLLGEVIEKLDALIGKDEWDILYTDHDKADHPFYSATNDFESDLKGELYYFWRPDMDLSDQTIFAKRTILNKNLMKIGCRMRTHSMIIRRSGIKKILDHVKERHFFLPYDHELAIVPNIKMVSLRYNHVTVSESTSDIQISHFSKKSSWDIYKEETLSKISSIDGWTNPLKADRIMDFIRENKPEICVEIGAFGGYITYPIARALSFLKQGKVYAIDAWDKQVAAEGLEIEKDALWWLSLDLEGIYNRFKNLILSANLQNYCNPIRKSSKNAVSAFKNETIDVLYIDGNNSKKGSLEDVLLYFPKVKEGGYIWITDTEPFNKTEAVSFLMKHCDWIKEKSIYFNCALFQKKKNVEISGGLSRSEKPAFGLK